MPPVNRNAPKRAKSSASSFSVMEFQRDFPDDAACLDYLFREHYSPDGSHAHCPRCDRERKFHRVKDRPAYDCDSCGYHLHPTAGTIFHKSSTSLVLWFYAIYLMSETRCGISAKHLERELGVTYKTAWRMLNRIRTRLMTQDDNGPMDGPVEMDETYVGGVRRGTKAGRPAADSHKTPVFGIADRSQGRVAATTVPNVRHDTLRPHIERNVLPETMVYTDEYQIYDRLPKTGYRHRRIHPAAKVYVDGDVHTNTIEGFFALVKNGIRGTHHAVSSKLASGVSERVCFSVQPS
jgi:transposase